MRAGHHRLTILDIGLVLVQPVSTRPFESFEVQGGWTVEHADGVHQGLERALEEPLMIVLIIVMRRDEYGHAGLLGNREQIADILDGAVLRDALPDHAPSDAVRRQEIILRIGDNDGCTIRGHHKSWHGQAIIDRRHLGRRRAGALALGFGCNADQGNDSRGRRDELEKRLWRTG